MKTYKIIILLAIGLTLVSCNDWLDVEPNTEMDRNELFKNEAGFADAMSGIYVNMASDTLYGKNMTWYMMELMGGGAVSAWGENSNIQNFSFQPKADYYMESERNLYIDPIWNVTYNTIANINSLLESIDAKKDVFTGSDYNIFKGEALGLRAFLHFDMMRLFSDAPTSADYSASKTYIPYVSGLTSEVYPLLTVEQCEKAILKDLTDAKELLKDDPMYTDGEPSKYVCSAVTGNASYRTKYNIKDWHNRRFHFNYYAVVATMARLYLWMGDKTNALACAKEVINAPENTFAWVNTSLVANTQSNSEYLSRDRTFCTEQIFALNIMNMNDRTDGILREGKYAFNGTEGNIEGINTSCFDATSQQSDPRYAYLKASYALYGQTFYLSTKYYVDPDYDNSYSPWARNRVPLMRASEMYYIAAECEPDLTKATEYLETVRRHRGLTAYPLSVSSREELQDQIELEYRKEFIAEGQMFYYYKRLNKEITNNAMYSSSVIDPKCFTMPRPDDEDTYGGRTTTK